MTELRDRGSGSSRAAVLAFGACHRRLGGAEPDWERADRHFARLLAVIAGAAPSQAAEREAVQLLPAVDNVPGHRCPICVRHEAPLPRPSAPAGGDLTDDERAEHAARLRGLLYLACPDAPAGALEYTAEAITLCAEEPPAEAVPEASLLGRPRQPYGTDPLNLCGADLRGANLTGADLSHADMYGADLSGADLTGANLSHANLTGAGLTHAILSGGDLTDAVLTGAELTEAVLTGAVLAGVTDLRVPE